MQSTYLEKAQSPVSGFCYARNRVCNAAVFILSGRSVTMVYAFGMECSGVKFFNSIPRVLAKFTVVQKSDLLLHFQFCMCNIS